MRHRNEKRCEVLVRAGTYRAPGQCEKRLGLKRVKLADITVLICAHHAAVIGRGTVPEVTRPSRKRNATVTSPSNLSARGI